MKHITDKDLSDILKELRKYNVKGQRQLIHKLLLDSFDDGVKHQQESTSRK